MLFTKKLKQEAKEDFALILNPVRNDIAKSRIIERMAQVFPLTIEEAGDLVENTPIVLLEGLGQDVGEQLRKYLAETNADLMLTEDQSYRRKCFRAIWPTPPNLSFLQSGSASEGKQEVPVREELDAVRQNQPEPNPEPEPALDPFSLDAVPQESADLDTWRKEKLREVEMITEQAIRDEKIDQLSKEESKLQQIILNLQRENDQLKTAQLGKDQYQKETQLAQAEIAKLNDSLKTSEQEKNQLKGRIQQLENEFSDSQSKLESELQQAGNKRSEYEQQISNLKSTVEKSLSELSEAKEALRKATDTQAHELEIIAIQNQKIQLEQALDEAKGQVSELQNTAEVLRHGFEEKIRSKEGEVTGWKKKVEEAATSHSALLREFEELRRKHASDVENLTVRNQELQNQYEAAQKQIREFAAVAEQQELIERRNRIAAQLLEKESLLRELSVRHEVLNSELKDREKETRDVLAKREQIEKDILKDRQADKYLLEQLKLKEKERNKALERFTSRRSNVEIGKPGENGLKRQ